jgi:hypothetical protein
MRLLPRRNKSEAAKAVDTIVTALKLGAVAGAVKGAGKGVEKGVKRATKRTPAVRKAPIVLAAGGAAVLAAVKLRSNGSAPAPPSTTG